VTKGTVAVREGNADWRVLDGIAQQRLNWSEVAGDLE
jgi:hypothetical protein